MYHMGWFLGTGYGLQPWIPRYAFNGIGFMDTPFTGRMEHEWMKPDIYCEMANSLERGGFDFLMFQDTSAIHPFRDTLDTSLRRGLITPKNDPLPLMPLITARTRHIGVVATMSSSFYPPYLAARLLTTLDHLTDGRVAFNLVTSGQDEAAQNYGMDALPPKSERYERGAEWVEVVRALQESWEPDAIVADPIKGIYVDHTKVHALNHQGKYYKVRGPLNTIPGPQRSVPMVEAGNSQYGLDVAAKYAEVLLAVAFTPDMMKSLRKDIHARMRKFGRDPSTLKLMFMADITLGDTDEDAQRRVNEKLAAMSTDESIESKIWHLEINTGIDFGRYAIETPVVEVMEDIKRAYAIREGGSPALMLLAGDGSAAALNRPLKSVLEAPSGAPTLGLVGSPDTVAAKMDEIMQGVGGDGFLINGGAKRHFIAEICDGLCPVLQRRGSIRSSFDGKTFRENLQAF